MCVPLCPQTPVGCHPECSKCCLHMEFTIFEEFGISSPALRHIYLKMLISRLILFLYDIRKRANFNTCCLSVFVMFNALSQ